MAMQQIGCISLLSLFLLIYSFLYSLCHSSHPFLGLFSRSSLMKTAKNYVPATASLTWISLYECLLPLLSLSSPPSLPLPLSTHSPPSPNSYNEVAMVWIDTFFGLLAGFWAARNHLFILDVCFRMSQWLRYSFFESGTPSFSLIPPFPPLLIRRY